jgi:hypothetical protein
VRYRLPFGPLGVLMHTLIVRRQIETIFDYRAQQVADIMADGVIYGEPPETAQPESDTPSALASDSPPAGENRQTLHGE